MHLRRHLLPLLVGAFLFSTHAHAAWVYHCAEGNQDDRGITLSNERYPTCHGGGEWIELTSFAEQEIEIENMAEFFAAIVMAHVSAFGFRMARKQMGL